ncbi:MAG TPA: gluconate:H+ symporter [Stackebrandtia sp.]|jgi:GntP family gluconate:H+ symporter|uniref:GntP family permease n=1 Tax=Stackebrandtia sp. TaxID=2023065 RepID=UPI002D243346|nr:gluconate:H+ symporter [Stackebrandtia sp.]HZE40679.1 gluconate:H+ symporter [Stackebrandtia sp.]
MTPDTLPIFLADDKPLSGAPGGQLILAALLGIATVVLLIVWAKFHPFIGLILGTAVLGAVAAIPPGDVVASFVEGLGTTFGSVGLLIALGAMLGKLLADSGGANQIVDRIIRRVGRKTLPWAMALIAAIIGLPMFFEIGLVILAPIILLVAKRTGVSLMKVGIPALAGLSILHGLVPPHPGPETAINLLHAPLSYTLAFGLIIAVPTLAIAGPLLAPFMDRLVPVVVGDDGEDKSTSDDGDGLTQEQRDAGAKHRPSFIGAILSVTLPVLLMLVRAIGDLTMSEGGTGRGVVDFIGDPSVALLAGVLVAMVAVGWASGMPRAQIHRSLGSGLPGPASIMLIVAAGGGFKTVLSDSGIAGIIGDYATKTHISVLLLGWLVAVAIRLATGSATVATVTAAGIVAPLGATLDQPHLALLVLAIGAGSLFFSHVNDAGFWLVKEYFGLTVGQTIKSWSVMETVISVVALVCALIIGAVV